MRPSNLVCLFHSDLRSEEREAFEGLVSVVTETLPVEIDLTTSNYFRKKHDPKTAFWVLARDWRSALAKTNAAKCEGKLFVSALSVATQRNLRDILFENLKRSAPATTQILTHSQINYRFFNEMTNSGKRRIHYLPLPVGDSINSIKKPRQLGKVCIGAYADFSSESNLHYLLSVGHFLKQNNVPADFKILGEGPLEDHLKKATKVLAVDDLIEIGKGSSLNVMGEFDIFVYSNLQSAHFLPVLAAAHQKIPVLASDIPGLSELIEDGKTGHLIPVNECEPMGKNLSKLVKQKKLRETLGSALNKFVSKHFSSAELASSYVNLFTAGSTTLDQGKGLAAQAI